MFLKDMMNWLEVYQYTAIVLSVDLLIILFASGASQLALVY
jgi:hypothetical protein